MKTKPLMVAEGDRIIREGLSVIRSPELLSELMTFVRLADGKTEAQEGCFDDLVIAWLIALQIRKYAPRKATTKEVGRGHRGINYRINKWKVYVVINFWCLIFGHEWIEYKILYYPKTWVGWKCRRCGKI